MPVSLWFYPVKKPPVDMKFIKRNWSRINESPIKHAGLLIRRIMRGSIRQVKTKRPSKPGTPPRSRDPAKRFKWIYSVPFDNDTAAVIGHVAFPQKRRRTVMETHEWGKFGLVKVVKKRRQKARSRKQARAYREKIKQGLIQPAKSQGFKYKLIKYKKRKFAWPALVKAKAKILPLWKGRINSSTVKGR